MKDMRSLRLHFASFHCVHQTYAFVFYKDMSDLTLEGTVELNMSTILYYKASYGFDLLL